MVAENLRDQSSSATIKKKLYDNLDNHCIGYVELFQSKNAKYSLIQLLKQLMCRISVENIQKIGLLFLKIK